MQTTVNWRPPRLQCAPTTPAVIRFQSGGQVRAKLQVISVTGGLLNMSRPLDQGSRVKLMFLMGAGSVLGTVEMLPSLSGNLQPFRFLTLNQDDERRLRAVIKLAADENRRAQGSIVKERTW